MKALIARYKLWAYRRAVQYTETRLAIYREAEAKYGELVKKLEGRGTG